METTTHHVLEINLISAQGLVKPSRKPHRRMKTYAIAWVDPSTKLRTRVDTVGGENPTWNDKFLFRVSPQFLLSKTSAVSVEIYSVGVFRDRLIGSVRVLISNFLPSASAAAMKTPAFAAYLIRNPSGDFFGALNVGGIVVDVSAGFQVLREVSGVDFHDLTGEHLKTDKAKPKAPLWDIKRNIRSDSGHHGSEANGSLTSSSSSEGRSKETLFEEDEKEEISCVNLEQPLVTNLEPSEVAENLSFDNRGSMVKMEIYIEMVMEENRKLRQMVEMLVLETEEQSDVISDLSGRVKNLEKKLSRRNRKNNPRNGRTASAPKFSDAAPYV